MGLWNKKSEVNEVKLPGPKELPSPVGKYLVTNLKIDETWISFLRSVIKNRTNGSKVVDIRIYDPSDAMARKISMRDYTSLDGHPEAVLYEGSFDEATHKVELVEKKKFNPETTIYSKEEMAQKVDVLREPGATVFFYQSRGPANGGPLGKGAAVIELNPAYPGKSNKKYNVYTADVVDLKPVSKGTLLTSYKDAKSVAKWVQDCHAKRWIA